MQTCRVLMLLASLFAIPLFGQDSSSSNRPTLQSLPQGAISADHSFVVAAYGKSFLYNSQAGVDALPFLQDVYRPFGFSNDGRWFLYLKSKGRLPGFTLYLYDLLDGTEEQASPERIVLAAWSPVSFKIAFITTQSAADFGIFVKDLRSGETTKVAEGMLDPEYLEWSGDGRELLFNRLSSLTSNYFENALVERALWRYDTRSDMSMEVAPESSVESSQAGIAGTGARNKGIAYRMAIANSNRYATITSGGKATVARWNTANSQFDIIAPGAIYASTRTGVIIRSFTPEGVMFHYADDSGQVKQLTGINRIEQQAASPLGFKEEGKVMTSQAGPVAAFSSSWKLPFAGAARLNQGGQLFSDGGCDGRACSIVSHGGPLGYALDLGQTAPQGPLRILAPEEGTVVAVVKDVTCNSIQPACNVGWDNYSQSCPNIGGSGNHVAIAHPDGSFSFYAHMRSFSSPLTVGQVVLQGDHLGDQGHSGSTGGASGGTMPPCGDHIHFQRQLSAAVWAQSIPTDFVELPCQLSCLTNYISQNIDRADSPATSSLTLILAPIAAVAGNTYPSHRVVLPAPAPVGGTMVSLSSSSPEIVLPASVSVPEGASFASFPITATPAASPSTVLITAQDGAQTATATLNVVPIGISSLVLSPTTVVGGSTTPNNELTLTHLAVHGASVEMSSTTPVAMPPSSLNIPAGSSFAGFPIVTAQTPTAVTATISATFGTSVKAADLQITALVLQSLTLGAVQVVGGGAVPGNRVVLNSAAGPGGAVVNLSSSDPTVALVPAGITVDAGATQSAAFSISTAAVTNPTTVTVTASYNGVNRSANLTVNPVALSSVSLGSATVVGGNTIQGNRVNLDFLAGPTEIAVTLSTSDASRATVPPSIVVPAGSIQSPEFTVSTFPVTATTTVNLIATYNGITKIAVITLNPVVPSSLTLGASTALGGETVPNNTVTLAGAAPGGGAVVILTSSNTAIAQVPANVTVPAGATVSPAFSIITSSVTASASVTITATYSGASVAATLTITPATAGTSLLAAYGFNEGSGGTTADSSGNGHTATLVGATWTTGKYGNGLAFNGTNQYATGTDIDFPSGPFTVSGWFKTTIQNNPQTIVSKYLSGTNQIYVLIRGSGGTPAGGILAGFHDGVNLRTVSPSQSYADNTWHHFAMVVTTSTLELFVDGVSKGTAPHGNSFPVNNVVWNMGRTANSTFYFQGSLDEIKFYNKALTAAEIIDDMNTPV